MSWGWNYQPYVSVAEKRRRAEKAAAKLNKNGRAPLQPIRLEGTKITQSFWGKSWCKNLESYSDYSNRLPRGRSYVRNGAVVDLKISAGKVTALVSGSSLYQIVIDISQVKAPDWKRLKTECAGRVGALIDLLQGKLAAPVMEIISRRGGGLFPQPAEIRFECSCPDSASMCKHIAATLYGIGARLDEMPELLFALRGVDHLELVTEATKSLDQVSGADAGDTLAADALSEVFGIEIDQGGSTPARSTKGKAKGSTKGKVKGPGTGKSKAKAKATAPRTQGSKKVKAKGRVQAKKPVNQKKQRSGAR